VISGRKIKSFEPSIIGINIIQRLLIMDVIINANQVEMNVFEGYNRVKGGQMDCENG